MGIRKQDENYIEAICLIRLEFGRISESEKFKQILQEERTEEDSFPKSVADFVEHELLNRLKSKNIYFENFREALNDALSLQKYKSLVCWA